MTNQLAAVLKTTSSKTNSNLKSINKPCTVCVTHKSADNETLEITTPTAPVTPVLTEHNQIKQNSNHTASTSTAPNDTNGRSTALERAYVHDVYEHCEEPTGAVRPCVAHFLSSLDPGSMVCDVGCGNGRYLTQINPDILTIGIDRCHRLSRDARNKGGEVLVSDNLDLPFVDDTFDAVISLAVIHHFATTERRVRALRELARVLRIGGRVVITVWALEQKNRRFESQDVLIPWQIPKMDPHNYSDEEDEDDFPPHYNAYTEESTNSSRSTGDGDSSSISSSSPGESCYGFVRRALKKLAGQKQNWILDSWTSKETKTGSIDMEDAKDLPIELRHLEELGDFSEPTLTTNLKTRSLNSILNPPPRQIVRSRSSVPSLLAYSNINDTKITPPNSNHETEVAMSAAHSLNHSPSSAGSINTSSLNRRPKLIKQKQSLCDEEYQLPEQPFHMISTFNGIDNSITNELYTPRTQTPSKIVPLTSSISLRKQSSLNEELMAGNRLREKEHVRKRIQKQNSLNEAFLCRSAMFSKRLQIIREGVTSSFKNSKGSLERVTKNGLNKIMQNIKDTQVNTCTRKMSLEEESADKVEPNCPTHQNQHHHHQSQRPTYTAGPYGSYFVHMLQRQLTSSNKYTGGPVTYCNNTDCLSSACYCSTYQHGCPQCLQNEEQARRHSHESGSDSSKDGSLQSDTSVESEDSFASVIFIPKPELQQQQQQQLQFKQQHQNSNSSSSNSSSSNGGCQLHNNKNYSCGCAKMQLQQQPQQQQQQQQQHLYNSCMHANGQQLQQHHHHHRHLSSAPTSPLVMPCPPTPAHSPAAAQMSVTSPPQTVAAVTAAMALLTSPNRIALSGVEKKLVKSTVTNCFNFDEAHLKQQQQIQLNQQQILESNKSNLRPIQTHLKGNGSDLKIIELNIQQEEQITKSNVQEKEENKIIEDKSTKVENKIDKQKNITSDKEPKEKQELQQQPLSTRHIKSPYRSPPKITRQIIQNLPPIPKFRKQQSLHILRSNFPIVRRSSATGAAMTSSIPKLMNLELFNPATDDLDSDSSEASSPDSVDSVISAHKSFSSVTEDSIDLPEEIIQKIDSTESEDEPYNIELNTNTCLTENILTKRNPPRGHSSMQPKSQEECAIFAEQLSAKLMECKKNHTQDDFVTLENVNNPAEYVEECLSAGAGSTERRKRSKSELNDVMALREELRERRLMLANLSTQPSQHQSPTSSSTSSLSSQTRSSYDEDADRGYMLHLYENCKQSKFNTKRNRQYNMHPETALLLQDDSDFSARDEYEDYEHDVILEEDEEDVAAAEEENEHYTETINKNVPSVDKPEQNHVQSEFMKSENAQAQATRDSVTQWDLSNSSSEMNSPSQDGATTHHRYYHVFREGELDALINNHVSSLHIVSSYYERASWCIVAEKVQVWTI